MNLKTSGPKKAITAITDFNAAPLLVVDTLKLSGSKKKQLQNELVPVKKILVADDDAATIDVVTLMLETAGYKVYSSADRHVFTDVIKLCPDLILLDILMSGVNGHDVCKELKNEPSTKHIPIIMISANKDANGIALSACADDFISKPFEMHSLLQKVATYTAIYS